MQRFGKTITMDVAEDGKILGRDRLACRLKAFARSFRSKQTEGEGGRGWCCTDWLERLVRTLTWQVNTLFNTTPTRIGSRIHWRSRCLRLRPLPQPCCCGTLGDGRDYEALGVDEAFSPLVVVGVHWNHRILCSPPPPQIRVEPFCNRVPAKCEA
jgi:hypothetical protein